MLCPLKAPQRGIVGFTGSPAGEAENPGVGYPERPGDCGRVGALESRIR